MSHTNPSPAGPACGQVARHGWLRGLTLTVLVAALGLALLAPSVASAAFTRPFVRQLTGTPTGPGGSEVPFSTVGGVAVDSAGNLLVGDGSERVDEFNSSGVFVETRKLNGSPRVLGRMAPASLSIDDSTGDLYVTGQETVGGYPPYVEVFDGSGTLIPWYEGEFGQRAHVAVDNSLAPFAGPVYVSQGEGSSGPPFGDGSPRGVEKFSTSGAPVAFSASASYIEGYEIVGTPSGRFGAAGDKDPANVSVDSHGNLYVIAALESGGEPREVDEYEPSGRFVRAFSGEETPGLGGSHNWGGWGGSGPPVGVAVDSASGHLLVSVSDSLSGKGAVDEFEISSGRFLNQITETSPGRPLPSAFEMAVDSNGEFYVVNSTEHAVEVYGSGIFLPSSKLAEVTERRLGSAVLRGSINPEGLSLGACAFQYVTEEAFDKEGFSKPGTAECEPAASKIPVDDAYHAVQAKLTALASGATYRYRLLATSEGALGGTSETVSLAFTTPHAPRVDSTSATNVSSTFADLRAEIDPLGADTTYHFEYIAAVAYEKNLQQSEEPFAGAARAPTEAKGDVDIGSGGPSGDADARVVQQVGGLMSGTTYHFRVTARNEIEGKLETTHGLDTTFTTSPMVVAGLPEGRAYELLTPPNKGSAEDMFALPESEHNEFSNNDTGYPSESGEDFLLETKAAFGSSAASAENAYVFSRSEHGWQTTALASGLLGVTSIDISPPVSSFVFDPHDLSRVAFGNLVGSLSSVSGTHRSTFFGSPGGPYTTVQSDKSVFKASELSLEETRAVGASRNLGQIVLESASHVLAPGAENQDPGSDALYEWAGGGECQGEASGCALVNVDSEGSLLSRCGATLGQGRFSGATHNAVSADGSKVFFTAPAPSAKNGGAGCWNGGSVNAPQLYMRSGGVTTEVSAPEAGVSVPPGELHPAMYVGASEDGSKVFFLSDTALTKGAAALKQSNDPELYEYDAQAPEGERLVWISSGATGNAPAHVYTVPAVSADGTAVYFTAFGQLVSGAPAVTGEEVNVYRYDTVTHVTSYVATVDDQRDYPSSNTGSDFGSQGVALNFALDTLANWYTTPDGRYLLFGTGRELTGQSTVEAAPRDCPIMNTTGSPSSGHCVELYRYHYEPGSPSGGGLVCVSCAPDGAAPTSNAFFGHSTGSETPSSGPVQAMSDDGSHVFFDTADALVPQDGNGTLDVYEWHDGGVSLISSGQDSAPSYFLGQSAAVVAGVKVEAANVFFGTHARLVSQDTDTAGDVYDARVSGGFGVSGGAGPCEGDACQNPPAAPLDATPGSLTFSGAGNVSGEVTPQVTPKKRVALTNAEKLATALKACRKKPRTHRKKCESQARIRYAKKFVRARHARTDGRAGR